VLLLRLPFCFFFSEEDGGRERGDGPVFVDEEEDKVGEDRLGVEFGDGVEGGLLDLDLPL